MYCTDGQSINSPNWTFQNNFIPPAAEPAILLSHDVVAVSFHGSDSLIGSRDILKGWPWLVHKSKMAGQAKNGEVLS